MRVAALLRNLLRRRQADRDLSAEINAFADEMNQRTPHSVYAEQLREQVRAARPGAGLESWARDLRYAGRMLRKTPALTLACVLVFALGVGANTVVFSMVNALVFRRLPVAHPDQLQMLQLSIPPYTNAPPLTRTDLRQLAASTHSAFSAVTSASISTIGVTLRGRARLTYSSFVSGNFFTLMGLRPALGHFFTRNDAPAMVLSYDYWRSRFHANPAVIGTPAQAEGRAVTIVGVAPKGFHGFFKLLDMQVYVPAGLAPPGDASVFPSVGIPIVRLRPGVTAAGAGAALALFARHVAMEHPKADKGLVIHLWPMATGLMSNQGGANPLTPVLALFLALSGLVLLLAAANIMGVLLARAQTRQREMAVRAALGAGRGRLARQVFLETLVLAAFGAALGTLLGMAASSALSSLPPQTNLPLLLDFSFDWHVFAFGCAMALVMALVAGILPAWRAASADANQSLRGPEAAGAGHRRQRLRATLVTAQVSASLMLLIVGGLFLRSLDHAQTRPLVFQPARVWNFELDSTGANLTERQGKLVFTRVLAQVRSLPGIASASLAQDYPFGLDSFGGPVHPRSNKSRVRDTTLNAVSPDYFATLGIPLLRGRGITPGDAARSTSIAVISASLARQLWPGQSPLGRRLVLGTNDNTPTTVVGVAGNVRYNFTFSSGTQPQIYFALAQDYQPRQILEVRTTADISTPAPEVEQLLQRIAPEVPLGVVQSLPAAINGLTGLFLLSLAARLATALGLLGLFLALIGVYGVVAYAAAQRTHELGIRMALGARPRQVLAAILRQAGWMIGPGVVAGLLAAAAIGKLAGAFLVGVSGLDPLTFIAATVLLAAVAFAASLVPAVRASRADPLEVLRCE
ncbi:MAG: ADOP family duplicated permease [Terriglobales bacterium]